MPNNFSYIKKFDWILFGTTLFLIVFGLAALYSTSLSTEGAVRLYNGQFSNFAKQIMFVSIGLFITFLVPLFNYRLLAGLAKVLYVTSAILLVAVLVFGHTIRGTRGWFLIGGFGIQPIEIVKFFLVVYFAKFFSDFSREASGLKQFFGSALAVGGIFLLTLMQPDFGSGLLLLAIWMTLLLLSGIKRTHLVIVVLFFLLTTLVAWLFVLKPYQKDRVLVFLNPERDPLGKGYNVTQSIIAIGSGGLSGKGLGFGSQSQLRFLPERQTDFIFSVIAEELGFFGVLFLCTLFAVFFYRTYLLARASHDDFTLFLVLGISASLAIEVFVNIGGNLRLLPVTGVTLPFVSYGGSSLLVKFLMLGVLESIAVRNTR